MFCMECGASLKADSRFCSGCGTNLSDEKISPAQHSNLSQQEVSSKSQKKLSNLLWISVPLVLLLIFLKIQPYFSSPKLEILSCAGDEILISNCNSIGINVFNAPITECTFNNPTQLNYSLSDYKIWTYDNSGLKLGQPKSLNNIYLKMGDSVRERFSPIYSNAKKIIICPFDVDDEVGKVFAKSLSKISVK